MAYNKKIIVRKDNPKDALPESTEWVAYRDNLISQGKIIKWDMSAFNADGIATINIAVDSEGTWTDIHSTSAKIRDNTGTKIITT
tara:strand:- start:3020 stop:3274 length:255 start_codon:yes stop_codon:yes gene_type:complete